MHTDRNDSDSHGSEAPRVDDDGVPDKIDGMDETDTKLPDSGDAGHTPTDSELHPSVEDDQPRGDDSQTVTTPVAGRHRTPWVLLGVLVPAILTLGYLQWTALNDARTENDTLRETAAESLAIRTASSDFAVALLTYDHLDFDAQLVRIENVASPSFITEYKVALEQGLADIIMAAQATAEVEVREVLVGDVSGGQARAVVIVDSEITSIEGSRASVDAHLSMTLLFLDGRWKVDDVSTLQSSTNSVTSPGTSDGAPPPEDQPADAAPDADSDADS